MSGIVLRINREHEAKCIAAIRERNLQRALADCSFEYRPWWRPRGQHGRFQARERVS